MKKQLYICLITMGWRNFVEIINAPLISLKVNFLRTVSVSDWRGGAEEEPVNNNHKINVISKENLFILVVIVKFLYNRQRI